MSCKFTVYNLDQTYVSTFRYVNEYVKSMVNIKPSQLALHQKYKTYFATHFMLWKLVERKVVLAPNLSHKFLKGFLPAKYMFTGCAWLSACTLIVDHQRPLKVIRYFAIFIADLPLFLRFQSSKKTLLFLLSWRWLKLVSKGVESPPPFCYELAQL